MSNVTNEAIEAAAIPDAREARLDSVSTCEICGWNSTAPKDCPVPKCQFNPENEGNGMMVSRRETELHELAQRWISESGDYKYGYAAALNDCARDLLAALRGDA